MWRAAPTARSRTLVLALALSLPPCATHLRASCAPCRSAGRSAALCSASRSTARPEEERFAAGADERKARLGVALAECGFGELDELLSSADFAGSAALRMYTSFVWPKSSAALANCEKPQRAAVVARQVAFLVREHRAGRAAWLRNHDRALAEVAGERHPLTLVLDNLRSAANVGNILRAAEAARLARVYHCGISPAPPDPKLLKTAMGSAEYVPHERRGSTLEVVRELRAAGVAVWAAETTERSLPHTAARFPRAAGTAIVLGNELIGVDVDVLAECDGVVQIPTFGVKNSLNVATAASVLVWEVLRQWEAEEEPRAEAAAAQEAEAEPTAEALLAAQAAAAARPPRDDDWSERWW